MKKNFKTIIKFNLFIFIFLISFIFVISTDVSAQRLDQRTTCLNRPGGRCSSQECNENTEIMQGQCSITEFCCVPKPPSSPSAALSTPDWKWVIPDPQIKIPGMGAFTAPTNCQKDEKGNPSNCEMTWINQYVAGIYNYAIGIVGILAAVVLMFGGLLWLTAGGNATRVGEAKAWIGASLTGLVIALTSYMILFQINPSLTNLKGINIDTIQKIDIAESDSGVTSAIPSSTNFDTCTGASKPPSTDILGSTRYMENCARQWPKNNCTNYVRDMCSELGGTSGLPSSNMAGDWYNSGSSITSQSTLKAGTVIAYQYTNSDGSRCASASGHAFMCVDNGCTKIYNNGKIISSASWRFTSGSKYGNCTKSEAHALVCK